MSSTTFITRKYICNECKKQGTAYCAVADIRDIKTNYTEDSYPKELNPLGLYKEVVVRDEYGIVNRRYIEEGYCEHCGSHDVEVHIPMKLDDVMNFYPPSDSQLWMEGFIKHIG